MAHKFGTFNMLLGIGPAVVTGLGFSPKTVLLKTSVGGASGISTDGMAWLNGAVIVQASRMQRVVAGASVDESLNTACLHTPGFDCTMASFDVDGFTMNYINGTADAVVQYYAED